MLACSLAGHSLAAMLCGTAVGAAERYLPRLDPRGVVGAISAVAIGFAIAGLR